MDEINSRQGTYPDNQLTDLNYQVQRARAELLLDMATEMKITLIGGMGGDTNYTIQPGDTLWDIAQENGIDVEELISYNDIANPNLIRPGQVIRIPIQSIQIEGIQAPLGVDIKNNIESASKMSMKEFYEHVRNKGSWDYKQMGKEYADFGNFNYGATGRAAGFSREFLLRMAGWAQQQAGTSIPEWGTPWGSPPYGDDPHDQEMIIKGMDYYDSGLWKK